VGPDEFLERYAATGDEDDYLAGTRLYEQALTTSPDDPELHISYGYLLEAHARNQLRQAVEHFERAIQIDPDLTKAHYQLIGARAGLREPEIPIATYEKRLEASPGELKSYLLLASAYLAAHEYMKAQGVVAAGLEMAPDDARLVEFRGEARAGLGDQEGALADWRRSFELDPECLSAVYSSAFLLERTGRLQEAIDAWQVIIDWSEARGYALDTIWPKTELARLQGTRSPK
jgi:tetratricopeptide (TPR) repeat protein